jgi:tRNA (cmo5U34)-methyltransferase
MDLNTRNNEMRDFFNRKIDEYDTVHSTFMNTKNVIADNLDTNTNIILDLGVGTGLELFKIIEKYPDIKITAIDISEEMLDRLSKRDFKNNINIICGDFFKVEFDSEYDAVISTSALHHFLYKDKLILYKKIYDSLKNNGLFINVDKIVNTIEEESKCLEDYNNKLQLHVDTPLTIQHEVEVMEQVGFKDIEVKEVEAGNYRLIRGRK